MNCYFEKRCTDEKYLLKQFVNQTKQKVDIFLIIYIAGKQLQGKSLAVIPCFFILQQHGGLILIFYDKTFDTRTNSMDLL